MKALIHPAFALMLLAIAAALLYGCSKDATTHVDRQVRREPLSMPEGVDADVLRSDCLDFMALEHVEALATSNCRTVLDWEWCPVMAVAMELRVENGQTIGMLAALWERDCV